MDLPFTILTPPLSLYSWARRASDHLRRPVIKEAMLELDSNRDISRELEVSRHPLPACQLLVEYHTRLMPDGYSHKADSINFLKSLGFELIYNAVKPDTADNAIFINQALCREYRSLGWPRR